jgi:hypothetical protein
MRPKKKKGKKRVLSNPACKYPFASTLKPAEHFETRNEGTLRSPKHFTQSGRGPFYLSSHLKISTHHVKQKDLNSDLSIHRINRAAVED